MSPKAGNRGSLRVDPGQMFPDPRRERWPLGLPDCLFHLHLDLACTPGAAYRGVSLALCSSSPFALSETAPSEQRSLAAVYTSAMLACLMAEISELPGASHTLLSGYLSSSTFTLYMKRTEGQAYCAFTLAIWETRGVILSCSASNNRLW
jgi:hypothetical protein